MPRLGRLVPPVVGPAVHVPDRRGDELRRIKVVEAGKIDRDELAADLLDVSPAERDDAALLAERPGYHLARRESVAKLLLAREQAKRLGLDADAPPTQLPTVGAVALAGAGGEVDVRFEPNFAAAAAAMVALLHR